jgi:uridine kinase
VTGTGLVEALYRRIAMQADRTVFRVAVTGVDGVGKTCLADALAARLCRNGHEVIRAGIDGFHNPRSVRYERGRQSPEGFYRDSFDLDALRRVLLDPLSPGGSKRYRTAWFDHHTDIPVAAEEREVSARAILVFDGIFLLQPVLARYWDLSIYLDAPFRASFTRMAGRDGSDADPEAAPNRRYRDGQLLYFKECQPWERADVLVDHTDLDNPVILRG